MKAKLNAYQGRLDAAQIAEGITAAKRNAKRLAEDSRVLFAAGRYPSAASLAILSIEEAGKTSILRRLALARDDKEVVRCWRDFRSHKEKNVAWILPELITKGARRLDDFRPLFEESSEHPSMLDQVKQISFYSDCLGKAHWSVPEEVVDAQLAKMLVEIAGVLVQEREATTDEIELWIKHLGPVWMTDSASMKVALVRWYSDMQRLGLAPEGENSMELFVTHGIAEK